MFGVERKFPLMYRKLKKILFHENLRIIYGNSRSQKTSCSALSMLSSIFQRPHVNVFVFVIVHWQCKVTTFGKGIVRFWPFTSIKCVIWPNKTISVHLQLQVDAILLGNVPHRHWWQQLVTGSYAEYGEFITMARKPSLQGLHWYARRLGKLTFGHGFHDSIFNVYILGSYNGES